MVIFWLVKFRSSLPERLLSTVYIARYCQYSIQIANGTCRRASSILDCLIQQRYLDNLRKTAVKLLIY